MKKVAKLDVELTVEERNLLSVGYKNVIGARRASWRIMSSIEQKEESKGNEQNVRRIKDYRHKVEEELAKICSDILTIIDGHLIPSSSTGESTVFYYKMYCIFALLELLEFVVHILSSFCVQSLTILHQLENSTICGESCCHESMWMILQFVHLLNIVHGH